jgi:hypothetical protein
MIITSRRIWRGLDIMELRRHACKIFAEKNKRKRKLRRPNCRREENIKMVLKERDSRVLTGFVWLTIVGGILCTT